MADDADRAGQDTEMLDAMSVRAVRVAAAAMEAGKPGECAICEEFSPRLVSGNCARCRDKYKLQ